MSLALGSLAAVLVGVGVTGAALLVIGGRSGDETASLERDSHHAAFTLATVAAMVAGFLVGTVLGGTPAGGFPVAMLCAGVPRGVRSRRAREHHRRLHQAWPDALNAMSVSVVSGRPLHAVMSDLAVDGPAPLRPFWERYRRLASTLDPVEALDVVRDEADDAFVDRLVEVLRTAMSSGPHVAVAVLRDLADAASDDLQFEGKVASASLEQKINSRVVAVVPCLALFLVLWSSEAGRAFYQRPIGVIVSLVGSIVLGVGIVIVDALGRLPSEPRVFVTSVVKP